MIAVTIHENVTIAKPSRFVRVLEYLVDNHKGKPKQIHKSEDMINPLISDSPYPSEIKIGTTIVVPNIARRAPIIFRRGLNLMMKIIFSIYLLL